MQREVQPSPDPSVLFYRRIRENGRTEFASMETIEKYDAISWRGRFLSPGQAPVILTQYSTELEQWEPVYALTQQDIEGIIERVAQRVTEILGTQRAPVSDIAKASMEVAFQETVPKAIQVAAKKTSKITCKKCGRSFKSEQGLKVHMARSH